METDPADDEADDCMVADVTALVRTRLRDSLKVDADGAAAGEELWRCLEDVLALTSSQSDQLQAVWLEYCRSFWLVAKDVLTSATATDRHKEQLLAKMRAENSDRILVEECADIVLKLLTRIDWDRDETSPGSQWSEILSPSSLLGSYWYCKQNGQARWLEPEIEHYSLPPGIEGYIDVLCRSLDTDGTKQIHQDVLWEKLAESALSLNAAQLQDVQRGWWEHTQQFW